MNPVYPSMKQLRHDALHSTIASVCGTAVEVFLCHGWANGYFMIRHNKMSESPLLYAAMSVLVTHLRIPHFYAIHRMMHPWRVRIMINLFFYNTYYEIIPSYSIYLCNGQK